MLLHKHNHRYIQIALLVMLLAVAIGLYSQWHIIISQVIEWQKHFHELLAKHIHAISQNPVRHGLALISLSFLYGVFHAVGPGHGKAIIVVYLSSHKESLGRGAAISLLAALLQAVVAIVLVFGLSRLLSIGFFEINSIADDVTQASYLLVMGLGVFLFITALIKQWRSIKQKKYTRHNHSHHTENKHEHPIHSHDTNHDHSCCGGKHAHTSDAKESWWQSIGVVFSMGIRPCAGAILVLIYAHLVGAFYYGIIAALIMGLGTGLAVAAMALGTQLARNWFEKLVQTDKSSAHTVNVGSWLRMAGGIVIFLLGLSLFQAAIQISGNHPLL